MSGSSEDHSIARIRTFKADVADVRKTADTTPVAATSEQAPQQPVHVPKKITPTTSAAVDAFSTKGVRSARSYLEAVPTMAAPDPVPTAATPAVVEETTHAEVRSSTPTEQPSTTLEDEQRLAKEITALSARSKKASILSDDSNVFDTNIHTDEQTGTIIQDKRRRRSGLLRTLITALSDALTPAKQVGNETKEDVPTEETKPLPKDDFAVVVRERVRAAQTGQQEIPTPATDTVTDSAPEAPIGWTHKVTNQPASVPDSPAAPELPTQLTPIPKPIPTTESAALSGGPMWQAPDASKSRVAVSKRGTSTQFSEPKQRVTVHERSWSTLDTEHEETVPTSEKDMRESVTTPTDVPTETLNEPDSVTPAPDHMQAESLAQQATPEFESTWPEVTEQAPEAPAPVDPTDEPVASEPDPLTLKQSAPITETITPLTDEQASVTTEDRFITEAVSAGAEARPVVGLHSPSGFQRLEIRDGLRAVKNAPTNSLMLAIMIVLSAITLGVFAGIHFFGNNTASNNTTMIAQPPALVAVTRQIPITLTSNREALLTGIRDIMQQESATVQIYPVTPTTSDREEPASAAAILNTFRPRINGSFERAITEMTFGSFSQADPFIVMKTGGFDIAFAGMLGWETNLSADLVPLFGESVTGTFDPQGRTADGVSDPHFIDEVIANRSARVLYDESGRERLLYVFINQHTVLITTNRTVAERLVPLVR